MMLVLLGSGFRGLGALPANITTNNFPVQIVTCEDGVDVDTLLMKDGFTLSVTNSIGPDSQRFYRVMVH